MKSLCPLNVLNKECLGFEKLQDLFRNHWLKNKKFIEDNKASWDELRNSWELKTSEFMLELKRLACRGIQLILQ